MQVARHEVHVAADASLAQVQDQGIAVTFGDLDHILVLRRKRIVFRDGRLQPAEFGEFTVVDRGDLAPALVVLLQLP